MGPILTRVHFFGVVSDFFFFPQSVSCAGSLMMFAQPLCAITCFNTYALIKNPARNLSTKTRVAYSNCHLAWEYYLFKCFRRCSDAVNMVLNVHRNHKVYSGQGEGGRGYGGGGWGMLHTYRYTVTTRMTCIKVGSDESHFNVS